MKNKKMSKMTYFWLFLAGTAIGGILGLRQPIPTASAPTTTEQGVQQ